MTSENSLVSVIVPVYNCERYLAEAIESILAQTYRPIEIIIVDDGSTDNTSSIAKAFGKEVKYFYQPNSGPPYARNRGLKMARGDIIGFLDADDLWERNTLEVQLSRLEKNPAVEIVLGKIQVILPCRDSADKTDFEVFADPWVALHLGSALFRKSVFEAVGVFDESLHYSDDWDWFMRARELGIPMIIHSEVTMFHRRHEQNITNQKKASNSSTLRMLKKSLVRRRKKQNKVESLPKVSDFLE